MLTAELSSTFNMAVDERLPIVAVMISVPALVEV